MKVVAVIFLIITIVLILLAARFISLADNSDARATAGLTLFPGIIVGLIDAVLWAVVWVEQL